jgi:hypothetical protein
VTSAQISHDPIPFPLVALPSPQTWPPLEEDEQEKLVLSHMEDVKQVARSILRRLPASVQMDDLIQTGSIGLIDAARRFSPCRNLPFRQYARIRITGAIFEVCASSIGPLARHFEPASRNSTMQPAPWSRSSDANLLAKRLPTPWGWT